MSRKRQRPAGPGAIELIEEAVHLLRQCPVAVLGTYYIGSLPFVLGFLYFWADMSRSSNAYDRCAPSAMAVGALFLWMKTWQSLFARQLKEQITGRAMPPVTVARVLRVGMIQTILQPSKLFLLAPALVITLPFGWVFAFYESVTAVGADEGADVKRVFRQSLRQSRLWQKENHIALAVLLAFGMVVLLNVAIGLAQIPELLKSFLAIETDFTRSLWSILNTTFVATCCGITYLCLDPILKAFYVLRCFYGDSLQTGEDLNVELKAMLSVRTAAGIALVCFLVGVSVQSALAADPGESPEAVAVSPAPVSSAELDRVLDRVIQQREYSWRLPREKPREDESKKGVFAAFFDGLIKTLREWGREIRRGIAKLSRWIDDMIGWLRDKLLGKRNESSESPGSGAGGIVLLRLLLWMLIGLAAGALALLFWRLRRRSGRRAESISEPLASVPDLADESVLASQMPEDEWLKLARESMAKGDLRLALRAFYLASLAHLAERQMITVAKFKSNRDYELELRRRARARPELQGAFAQNVTIFDRVWYGMHEVTADLLRLFESNFEKIKTC